MRRNTYSSILIITISVLALAAIIYLLATRSTTDTTTVETGETTVVSDTFSIEEKTLEDARNSYELSVRYPQVRGAGGTAERRINRLIAEEVENLVEQFREDVSGLASDQKFAHTFDMSYEVTHTSDTISVLFSGTQYIAGAAHPNTFIVGRTYDTQTGARITIEDLVPERSLQAFAEVVRKQVVTEYPDLAESLHESGLSEEYKNFSSFTLSPETLTIYFAPYQIAPYAAGSVEVSIPYKELPEAVSVPTI